MTAALAPTSSFLPNLAPGSPFDVEPSPDVMFAGRYPVGSTRSVTRLLNLTPPEPKAEPKVVTTLAQLSKDVKKGGKYEGYRLTTGRDDVRRMVPNDMHSSSHEADDYPEVRADGSFIDFEESEDGFGREKPSSEATDEAAPLQEVHAEETQDTALFDHLADVLYEADDEGARVCGKRKVEEPDSPKDPRFEARMERRRKRFAITCYGCRHREETGEEMANQLAHMEDGGCVGEEALAADPDVSSDEE